MQSYITVILQFCEYNCFQLPLFVIFNGSGHYFDTTVGFLGPENVGLPYLFKFLSGLEAEILQNMYFMAAILKIQNGRLNGVCANANINFWIFYVLMIPKMYSFANLQKF